eukprot:10429915-Alexandrium_andersonii.AAC.1
MDARRAPQRSRAYVGPRRRTISCWRTISCSAGPRPKGRCPWIAGGVQRPFPLQGADCRVAPEGSIG